MELCTNKLEFSRSDINKGTRIPKRLDGKLGEEIGVFLGDGYLSDYSRHFELGFSGHSSEDRLYLLNYLQPLMKKLYNHRGTIIESAENHTIEVRFWSKAIFIFHSKVLGLPVGKKNPSLRIPNAILDSSEDVILRCMRGLADTDASLTFKRRGKKVPYYPVIKIELASRKIMEQIANILENFNLDVTAVYNVKNDNNISHQIELNGAKNLEKWMNIIGFRNPKHLAKYLLWRKNGYCPPIPTSEKLKILINREKRSNSWESLPVRYLWRRRKILHHLGRQAICNSDLSKEIGEHRNTTYSQLKRLEKMGLARRVPLDRKTTLWKTTKESKKYLQVPETVRTLLFRIADGSGGAAGI